MILEETNGVYEPTAKGNLKFSLKPSLGLEASVLLAKAYAGVNGNLSCELKVPWTSLEDALKVNFTASFFMELSALGYSLNRYFTFADTKLYPTENNATNEIMAISSDDLELIPRLTQTTTSVNNDSEILKEPIQIYCKPQIISLGNGNMFMTCIIDDLTNSESDENKSTLMYCIYDGTSWSDPQAVWDDGTADFEPSLYPDGNGGVHIVWQNATATFSTGTTLEEMSTAIDLYYTHWNGLAFENTYAITNNNSTMETAHKIVASGNNVTIIWEENSENDPFAMSGTNSIYRRQFSSGIWQNAELITSNLLMVTGLDTTYVGTDNVIAYTVKTNNNTSTLDDLELFYFDGTQILQITDDTYPDYSASFLDNEIYWISENSIVSANCNNLDARETIVEVLDVTVSEIKTIGNENGDKSIVWQQEKDSGMTFFATNYNTENDSFDSAKPLTTNSGIIRGWDACMLPNGQTEMIYGFAQKLDQPIEGKPYNRIDLIQETANNFYDISVSPNAIYQGDIKSDAAITIVADVYNVGSLPLSQFQTKVFGANGDLLQTLIVNKDLAVGDSTEIEIPFTLTSPSHADYRIEILPVGGNDISLSDNNTTCPVGFADIAISDIQEIRTELGRQLKVKVTNDSFEPISSATLKLLEGSIDGDTLGIKEYLSLTPFGEAEFTFEIAENDLNSNISEEAKVYYAIVETSDIEDNYGNNSKDICIYPDYYVTLTAGTGGTVSGAGIFEKNSSAKITAIPSIGYIFDGWYENGKLIEGASSTYKLTINSNRTLEAHFKSNDLTVTDLEICGNPQVGNPLTFTAFTEGGQPQYEWTFYIYGNGTVQHSNLGSESDANFFTYIPTSPGTYTVAVYVTDAEGFRVKETQQFTIV